MWSVRAAVSTDGSTAPNVRPGSDWYRDAIFYEVPVKSFFDSNGDGIGDFRGLIEKLDYLVDLGASCLWLHPFFTSPLHDDGYDVTDYRAVHPSLGTIDDLRRLLQEAKNRQLRVVAEMVINHTSDEHPWFQAARTAPPDSTLRNFYVWREKPDGSWGSPSGGEGGNARWTWDDEAEAFYWHRFAPHQPDLNYDNPAVREEVLNVLRFWASLGVDGLCLNGASFLVEREGTRGEHLPETHEVLRYFREKLSSEYPDVMLQAGVNAWPTEAHRYFGNGDECQMAPQLALAQRMFLALRQENREPLVELLRKTPDPPAGCQWVTLLRNHDELTLSLATDEERDYLFREYACDPSMRWRSGILRRLAPLVDNGRRRIELLFSLLFSVPGSPMIYYGDEMGMGDNVFLGGRAGIRTPMQWASDRNAGFSTADFARLYAPPVMDSTFGYESVNVEAQLRSPTSLFRWVRRLIGLRKNSPAFARGTLEWLEPENNKVLAFVRRLEKNSSEDEIILVVANLARTSQPAQLDLSDYAGLIPVEMFGRTPFPRIGNAPYVFTLGPHSFLWFRLQRQVASVASRLAPVQTEAVEQIPLIETPPNRDELFQSPARDTLEQHVLPGFLRAQRWFGGKSRRLESVSIADYGPIPGTEHAFFVFLKVAFEGGTSDLYFVPMAVAEQPDASRYLETMRRWVIAQLRSGEKEAVLFDALADDAVCSALLNALGNQANASTGSGEVAGIATEAFTPLRGRNDYPLGIVRGPATSSNSLIFFGRRLLLKLFRRLEPGTNPDFEVGRFLTEKGRFGRVPQVAGTFAYRRSQDGHSYNLAILQAMVSNQGDGWSHVIDELGRYYDRAFGRMHGPNPPSPDHRPLHELVNLSPPPAILETIGGYLNAAESLGRRTAEMHLAIASDLGEPDFAPEPLDLNDVRDLASEITHQAELAFTALASNIDRLPPTVLEQARTLLKEGPHTLQEITEGWHEVPHAVRTRVHGDYHLGQVLWAENDYIIIDFEGEPTRTVEERRAKFSPLRDVAGMLRSYHYAAYAGLFAFTQDRPDDVARLAPWADMWQQWVSATFVRAYLATAGDAPFVPRDGKEFAFLLDGFTLAKALYELAYELNNRPDWVRIPMSGVWRLLESHLHQPAVHTLGVAP